MANIISGNFAANGSSDEFTANSITVCLGNDTNANFGGGTISLKVKQDDKLDWTVDSTYTATGTVNTIVYAGGLKAKIELTGATTPNLDYSIKYE